MDAETKSEIDFEIGSNLPADLTLRRIFNRNKVDALDNAARLAEMIWDDVKLNGRFGEVEATENNCPMLALQLAQELCDQLRTLQRLKLIFANEDY